MKTLIITILSFTLVFQVHLNKIEVFKKQVEIDNLNKYITHLHKDVDNLSYYESLAKAPKIDKASTLYMAATMWGEARNQGEDGMREVGKTILARANTNKPRLYGHGVVGVILHHKQFSCWNRNDPNYKKLLKLLDDPKSGDKQFQKALKIAHDLMIEQPTNGALFYHTHEVNPRWAKNMKVAYIKGDHRFYYGK